MKKLLIISVILVLSISGLILYKNSSNKEVLSVEKPILSEQIKSKSGQIIDVREPSEYIDSHANNAINVPLGNILNGDYSKIDKSKPIYVYCRSGVRAGKAKEALEKAGYKNVINIGGLSDWVAKQGKTCSATEPSC